MTLLKKIGFFLLAFNFLLISESMAATEAQPQTNPPQTNPLPLPEKTVTFLKLLQQSQTPAAPSAPQDSCSISNLGGCCSDYKSVDGCHKSCGTLCSEAQTDCAQDCQNNTQGDCGFCQYLNECNAKCDGIKTACAYKCI